VFKNKVIENEYERHKARLVVKGYMQQQGVHNDCVYVYCVYAVVFADHFSGFLADSYGIDKYERIQILGFRCDIGLCVSAVAGVRNSVHGTNSRFVRSLKASA